MRGKASARKAQQKRNSLNGAVDDETERKRAQHDARGKVEHYGLHYSAEHPDGQPWAVVRSVAGRLNQVDVTRGGQIHDTCGLRDTERGMKRAKL